MMPSSFHSPSSRLLFLLLLLLLLFFLSSHTSTAGRFLLQKQGKEEMNLDGFSQTKLISELEEKETWKLMGVEEEEEEECHNGDEDECLKRRMISEAHLDYIYTQHHKP